MRIIFISLAAIFMMNNARAENLVPAPAPPKVHQDMIRNAGEVPAYSSAQPAESVSAMVPDTASALNPDERIFLAEVRRMNDLQILAATHLLRIGSGEGVQDFASTVLNDHQLLNASLKDLVQETSQEAQDVGLPSGQSSAVINAAKELSPYLQPLNRKLQEGEKKFGPAAAVPSARETTAAISRGHSAMVEFIHGVSPGFQDPNVRKYADEVLRLAERHQEDAARISEGG